jgi:glycosyltransferase involved in cell wall biosynthesis
LLISFIVFARNAGIDFFATLDTIQVALSKVSLRREDYEIICVDDGSTFPPTSNEIFSSHFVNKLIRITPGLGISGAIYEGALEATGEYVIAVPGSNMFAPSGIQKLLSTFLDGHQKGHEIFLGFRENSNTARPVVTGHFEIRDIHGLNIFKRDDMLRFLPRNGKHGGQLQLLASCLKENTTYLQVPVLLLPGHKSRISATWRNSFPSLPALFTAFKGILKIIYSFRSRKSKCIIRVFATPPSNG